ncbi:hypothetical protein GIB67_012609 [Kingdonia uniflora]|uniref:UspA domain-containing protein n=1 Tax=Kingdonia uniflora TaxID=39325 RepID=A0A7J7NFE8_9MAGN|nr:hypothetical protein GIB67_012609 [Kingdonia uniflora]
MAEEEEVRNSKKVMIAIDQSEFSYYALKWTLENLRDTIATSPLLVFTSQPIADYSYIYAASFGAAAVAPPQLVKSVQEHQKKISSALLEKAKQVCASKGVVAETFTVVGDPKEAICEAVDNFKIDLLVVGNQGKGAIKR